MMISTPMSGPATALTPFATTRSASMSNPESVSSRIAIDGFCRASWRISIRFFSPPENPSFRYRVEKSRGTLVSFIAASTVSRNSRSGIGSSPCASRWAFMTVRRYLVTVTPGHRDRVLEGHEQAHPGALVGVGLGDVLALEDDLTLGHLEPRMAHDRVGERRLARAVRAHQRVDLALADGQIHTPEDLLLTGADVKVSNL